MLSSGPTSSSEGRSHYIALHVLKYALATRRSASDIAEAKKQLSDFRQCKSELSGTLNDCQAVEDSWIETSLPAEPLCRRKQANPLVIANRRRSNSNLPRHLQDGQLGRASF